MARLDSKFVAPFVEIAVDREAALERMREQLARVPELKQDCKRFGQVADYARLARSYARAADAAYLAGEYGDAAEYSGLAERIFEQWNKPAASFLNELRLVRSRVQLDFELEDAGRWYRRVLSTESRERELYLDWIDVGYVEFLVATGDFDAALDRYDAFFARWSQRPNLDVSPYVAARELLVALVENA